MRTAETALDMLTMSKIAARDPVKLFMCLPEFEQTDRIALRDARSLDSSYSASWLCLGTLLRMCNGKFPEASPRQAIQPGRECEREAAGEPSNSLMEVNS